MDEPNNYKRVVITDDMGMRYLFASDVSDITAVEHDDGDTLVLKMRPLGQKADPSDPVPPP